MDNFFGLNKDWFDEKEYFVGNERKLINPTTLVNVL
jgi:hypothetical protein